MGMLIDFYTGDAKRIVDAWHSEDAGALADPRVVAAHADRPSIWGRRSSTSSSSPPASSRGGLR